MTIDTVLQYFGLAVGLVYLYYEYYAKAQMWVVGIVMPLISMWVYFRKGLYADFGMNVYYFLMAVYGYLSWTGIIKHRRKTTTSSADKALAISHVPIRACFGTAAVTAVLWGAIYLFLHTATDSTVPVADAFTTALSITATWMLARKYIEQWLAWIAVDGVCVGLYIYKGIYPYALLYTVYTVVAVAGYMKWRRMMTHRVSA